MNRETGLRKDLTAEEFTLFRDWIHQHSGIFLEDSKSDSLRISLVTRATRFGFTDYQDYFTLLANDEAEFKELISLVTINETSFFRFPAQFTALRDAVIPEILEGRPKDAPRQFRVWSAGCSTGEEPYTLSMTLLESALEGLGYRYEVVGTDVSNQALDKAKAGIYPARSVNTLQQSVVQRWFEPTRDGHRPIKRVRDHVSFHYHNLIKEPYPLALMSNWDVIFCRNVTIYFKLESTRRVVDNFFEALNPGGYLFIGHSETLTSVSERFEPVEIDGVFLYRKPVAKRGFRFEDILARRAEDSAARRARRAAESTPKQRPARERKPLEQRPAQPTPTVPAAAAGDDEVAQLVQQAHDLLEMARAREALGLAEQALAYRPDHLDAHVVAAFALADLGDVQGAAAQARAALAVNALAAPARYILGVIAQQSGDLEGALAEYKKTIYIDRDFVLAHFAVANIHKQKGRKAEACRAYENTLRSLHSKPEGAWTTFLGGFKPDLLAQTCERSLLECKRTGS